MGNTSKWIKDVFERIYFIELQLKIDEVSLKEPQVIETRAFPRINYALITLKTQVEIYFVQ